MELTEPEKIFLHGASPSMVALWQLCPKKWWLHYVAKKGRDEKEAQKDAGTAIHNFLQTYYDPDLREAVPTEDNFEMLRSDFPEEQDTDKRSQKHILAVAKAYTERYPRESEPFEVLGTEVDIVVPLEGCVLPLHIKVDAVVEWMNGLWALDHKTTNSLGATFFEQFRNNWQTYCYIDGVARKYARKCEGILYNAVGFKQKIDGDSFLRKEFAKTDDQLKYHMSSLAKKVNQMYEFVQKNWQNSEEFLMNPGSACRAYNVNCPFLDYCEFNGNERLLS